MKVIGVLSGKGGVGKTTTVANLGAGLISKFKTRAVILDGNATTPDLGLHLGMYHFPYTLEDVLEKKVSIDQAIYEHWSGVSILPSSLSLSNAHADLRELREFFLKDLEGYELVLIDSYPGLGEEIAPTLSISDEILIVTNPELPAVTDALRAMELAEREGVRVRGVVLNRVRREKYELSIIEVESVFDAPVIAVVPEDAKVRESIAVGVPVVLNSPSSPAAVEFKKLAAYLIGEEYKIEFFTKIKNILNSLKRRLWKRKTERGQIGLPKTSNKNKSTKKNTKKRSKTEK